MGHNPTTIPLKNSSFTFKRSEKQTRNCRGTNPKASSVRKTSRGSNDNDNENHCNHRNSKSRLSWEQNNRHCFSGLCELGGERIICFKGLKSRNKRETQPIFPCISQQHVLTLFDVILWLRNKGYSETCRQKSSQMFQEGSVQTYYVAYRLPHAHTHTQTIAKF